MRKFAFIVILLIAAVAACDRPPTPKEVPIDHSNTDHSRMDHGSLQSSPGAADAPYELQFIDSMIAHHQGAIDMARFVATRAQHEELKALAANIITDQQRDIERMQEWRSKWFGTAAPAVNLNFPGMMEGMHGMDLEKLDPLKANAFDLEFIRQMIPHHEGAVTMAKDALQKETNAEIKALSQEIIKAQENEIGEMKQWQAEWSK